MASFLNLMFLFGLTLLGLVSAIPVSDNSTFPAVSGIPDLALNFKDSCPGWCIQKRGARELSWVIGGCKNTVGITCYTMLNLNDRLSWDGNNLQFNNLGVHETRTTERETLVMLTEPSGGFLDHCHACSMDEGDPKLAYSCVCDGKTASINVGNHVKNSGGSICTKYICAPEQLEDNPCAESDY